MITIYKQVLELEAVQEIMVPVESMVLCCQVQNDKICIWYKCDSDLPRVKMKIRIHGTGHEIREDNLMYIGTVQMIGGDAVWHVFEEGEVGA